MKKNTKSSLQVFEAFSGKEEKRFLNWLIIGDLFFLMSTLILMFVAENIFHMDILGWKQYWILFFFNVIFFVSFYFGLKNNFKIELLKYSLAIFSPMLVGGWIYFLNPVYSKVLFAFPMTILAVVGFTFYNSQLLLTAFFTIVLMFGFLFSYLSKIGSPMALYEIYLIYTILSMSTILYIALVERTKVFLKELVETRSELQEAKDVLEIKVIARTKELEKLSKNLDQRVKERTRDLEEGRKGLLNILQDVAESRQEAEEERNKTLAIITNFTDGLLVFNNEKKLSLINPQAESFLDIKSAKVLGKTLSSMSRMPNLKPLISLLGKDISSIFRKELKLHEDLTLEVSVISILREGQDESLVVLHDTTREKLVERMKTEFVSIAAHQLRTPLSAIKWTLKTLLDGDLGKITKEQEEFIGKTYQSNERMIGLINDLLNVTRIEEGKYLYKLVLSDMREIVQSLVEQYKDEAKKRNLKLEFKKSKKKLPKTLIDVEKINLVVGNILDNAIRYNNTGGEIKISLEVKNKEIEFIIEDTGVGIPQKQQKRIFSKFFRGANVMRMDTEGSGLGLFIAKNIIEAHKGRIWFESKEGKGAVFHFTLPIHK